LHKKLNESLLLIILQLFSQLHPLILYGHHALGQLFKYLPMEVGPDRQTVTVGSNVLNDML